MHASPSLPCIHYTQLPAPLATSRHFLQARFPFSVHYMSAARYYSDTDYPSIFPLNDNPFYLLWRQRR